MTDKDLVEGCMMGKAHAQKALYDQYAGPMMSLCLRYTNGKDEAQDILQEGFIKVFKNMSSYSGSGPLGGWIRRIMINTALIHIRKEKKWAYKEDVVEQTHLSAGGPNALDDMTADELMKIINSMPMGYKTVFNLYAIEGYKHKEIAEKLDISENTSKTQYKKARAYIQKLLEEIQEKI